MPANWVSREGPPALGGVLKYFNSAPPGTTTNLPSIDPNAPLPSLPGNASGDIVPERRLARRVINLSAAVSPGATDLSDASNNASNWTAASAAPTPDTQDASQPLLGIFSGKPMPDWPAKPSIFQPKDQSSPDDNELFQRWMRWVDG